MLKRTAVLAAFFIFCTVAAVWVELVLYAKTPGGSSEKEIFVSIPSGESFRSTAARLRDAGLVSQSAKFRWYARLKGYDKQIKAGEYTLLPTMTPEEILQLLISGKVRLYKITVPEGYSLRQTAALMGEKGFSSKESFLKAATDAARIRPLGVEAETLEGYLFPDTYHFPKGVTAKDIVHAMVDRFQAVFTPLWKARAAEMGMTIHQVVTLASIIEKETGAAFERPLISSVFHNRLKRGMRLASDPTVIYGIENFDGNLTRRDLETWTPYNTYRITGLPPGPIASPGAESLQAALYPEPTDYLYFVSKKDNTHQFSTNLKDHNRAVRKYQLRK